MKRLYTKEGNLLCEYSKKLGSYLKAYKELEKTLEVERRPYIKKFCEWLDFNYIEPTSHNILIVFSCFKEPDEECKKFVLRLHDRTIKKMEKILKNIDKIVIERQDFEYDNHETLIRKKYGTYFFEFVVQYEKNIKNYFSATYEQPEECDIEFLVTDITNLDVYGFKNRQLDLTAKNIDRLETVLKDKFVGNTY